MSDDRVIGEDEKEEQSVNFCLYCGHRVPLNDVAAMSEHIWFCEKHPLGRVLRVVEQFRDDADNYEDPKHIMRDLWLMLSDHRDGYIAAGKKEQMMERGENKVEDQAGPYKLNREELRKAIRCAALLPPPGKETVQKIASSHLLLLDELDIIYRVLEKQGRFLDQLKSWTNTYGEQLNPPAHCADTYGDGVREMKEAVQKMLKHEGVENGT